MDPASWNQVALNLVNHLAGHPELALVALLEIIRRVGMIRGSGGGADWSPKQLNELQGFGPHFIVILKIVIGGGFTYLGMLTYLLRVV